MKMKKLLASLLVLCMVLGCMSVTAFAEEHETIVLGESKTITVPANGGEYIDVYVFYTFIPEESGTYAFLLSYDEGVDIEHDFYMDVAGPYMNIDGGVQFVAQAGQEYELMFNYWGEYTQDMEYTLSLEESEGTELFVGENPVTVPGDDYLEFSFTPEESGCYLITVDSDDAYVWLGADSVYDDTNEYYVLEAGQTYYGDVSNWSEEDLECTVTIEYAEDVVIPEPVAIEITKAPDNTAYFREALDGLWTDQLYAGMEMIVTWSDESTSTWKYDEDGSWIGNYYLEYELVETDSPDKVEMKLFFYDLDVEPVSVELTILDLSVDHLELADPSPLQIVENSCGIDIGVIMGDEDMSGWYYLPLAAYTREVVIVFTDDSTVNAMPGEYVYGMQVYFEDNQEEQEWIRGGENWICYYYGDHAVQLDVEIVDSPVESIEMVTPPKNDTIMINGNYDMIGPDGEIIASFRQLFEGMSLKVNYKDGTSKTFDDEDFVWVRMDGLEYPLVDGYPLGILNAMLGIMDEEAVPPCEIEVPIEYMGAETSYTLNIVEEFGEEPDEDPSETPDEDSTDKPEIEPIPVTGDTDLTVIAVVTLAGMLCAVVLFTEKKKLF